MVHEETSDEVVFVSNAVRVSIARREQQAARLQPTAGHHESPGTNVSVVPAQGSSVPRRFDHLLQRS